METSKQRKRHSKNYKENVEKAKKQIKEAEEGMKKMDQEVKEFHSRMTNSMAQLMKTFSEGFEALDKAKKDDPDL
jgi:molecular chaperone GrpE (heat shock protein)